MKYDIIIPHFNAPGVEELALSCVRTIKKYSKDYRIIWIQNGGEPPESIQAELSDINSVIVSNMENVGFVKAINQGLLLIQAPYVVIMNNDTEAVECWLDKLVEPLVWPVVMSGPRTNTRASWQGMVKPGEGSRILAAHQMLAFFCTMFDARVFPIVGQLDEDFGVGFGDDDNYCARVHSKGLRMVLVQDLVIPHKHRTTFKAIYSQHDMEVMQRDALTLHYRKLKNLL